VEGECHMPQLQLRRLTVERKDDAIQMFEIMSRGDDMVSIIPE
jgi:hypothetical protein